MKSEKRVSYLSSLVSMAGLVGIVLNAHNRMSLAAVSKILGIYQTQTDDNSYNMFIAKQSSLPIQPFISNFL